MKKLNLVLAICFFAFSSLTSYAQLQLPQKSPKASVSYTLGLTEIKIDYSAPAVNDRTIWGDLVPYDEVWRTGANSCTKVSFSTDVKVEGKMLEKGTYALFITPKESGNWIVHFNSDTEQWGAYAYDPAKDVLTVEVEPKSSKVNEKRLNFSIVDFNYESGYIRLGWEKMRVYIRIRTTAIKDAMANVETALENVEEDKKWQVYAAGADFLLGADKDLDQALEWATKSASMQESSWNHWVLAQIQAKKGDSSAAVATAGKSLAIGAAAEKDGFYNAMKETIEKTIESWKGAN